LPNNTMNSVTRTFPSTRASDAGEMLYSEPAPRRAAAARKF
jgi:hypothetical protein